MRAAVDGGGGLGASPHRCGRARVTPHRVPRAVRDRDCRPDPARRRQAGQTAGHGAGPFRAGVRKLTGRAWPAIPRLRRGRGYGRVLRMEAGRRPHAAHGVYQRIIACYRRQNPRQVRRMMSGLIDALANPAATRQCPELQSLGRTLKRRRVDILAYFTHRHSSNGPHRSHQRSTRNPQGNRHGIRQLRTLPPTKSHPFRQTQNILTN